MILGEEGLGGGGGRGEGVEWVECVQSDPLICYIIFIFIL